MKKKYFFISLIILVAIIKFYRSIPYRIEFIGYYDKIWSHRNNSIDKALISEKFFKGIELDIVYNETGNFLDIYHPPAKSINLYFEKYINSLKTQPFIWLDIKNLNNENSLSILNKIKTICNKINYPTSKLLIESRYPKALKIFNNNGFKTSYYLNYKIRDMDSIALIKEISTIKKILINQPKLNISSDYINYYVLNKYFPNIPKNIWVVDGIRKRNYKKLRKALNDTTVKVVLIQFKPFINN